MNSHSIVLTGFMGTGKTAVGRCVSERLGREFVDVDAVIEAREGKSVRAIFTTRGEEYFRAVESALCKELGGREGLVIATGGGALVNSIGRAQFANASVVCLDATVDAVLMRLKDAQDRPLLAGDNLRDRVEALMAARRTAYAQIPIHVDTTGKTIEQVADQIIALLRSEPDIQRLDVTTPEGAYPVLVGAGMLDQAGSVLARLSASNPFSSRCALITNPRVGGLYAARVIESLRTAGFDPSLIEIPDGEEFKTLATVSAVYDQLVHEKLDRHSAILALAGGVVGDLAGFVAATFLRGVPFVQLPTTLLAMVDASIGGKVAVDHPGGKNLVGAFKQPLAILADTDTLATLPSEEWRCGMAEVVKHAIIRDAGLFEELETTAGQRSDAKSWIERAMQVKVDIVSRDPFEQNERAKLNLGHTFGHALEKLSNYRLRHGDAVAIGLVCATNLATRLGLCRADFLLRLENLMGVLSLPTRVPVELSEEAILGAMTTDKKRVNGRLRFVLPRALGDVVIVSDVAQDDVAAAIEKTRRQV